MIAVDDIFVEGVFEKSLRIILSIKAADICFVVAKQNFRLSVAMKRVISELGVLCNDCTVILP